MFRIAQLALLVGSFVGVLALAVSWSHADGPDAKNAAPKNAASNNTAPKNGAAANTAANPVNNVVPLKRPDPNDNMNLWLNESPEATVEDFQPTAEPEKRVRNRRPDALPGVVELSNGKQMPGLLYTTRGKDWELYVDEDRTWHRIPPITVLSMTAKVDEELEELEWRWVAMGVDERVYTGRSYPMRRLSWTIKLIDGTTLHGTIKGQPIFVNLEGTVTGPLVLHERQKGDFGETLKDLLYVRKVVVSKRMMDAVVQDLQNQSANAPAGQPAATPTADTPAADEPASQPTSQPTTRKAKPAAEK